MTPQLPRTIAALTLLLLVPLACSGGDTSEDTKEIPNAATDSSADGHQGDGFDAGEDGATGPPLVTFTPGQEVAADLGLGGESLILVDGRLPAGVFLDGAGHAWGRPTRVEDTEATLVGTGAGGDEPITVRFEVRDGALAILPLKDVVATRGAPFEATPEVVEAAEGALTWSIGRGALPGGVALDEVSGRITGAPTEDGLFPFVLRATDASGEVASLVTALRVAEAPILAGWAQVFEANAMARLIPNGMLVSSWPDGRFSDHGDSGMWTGTFLAAMAFKAWLTGEEALAGMLSAPPEGWSYIADGDEIGYVEAIEGFLYPYVGDHAQRKWFNMNITNDAFWNAALMLPDGEARERVMAAWRDEMWRDHGDTPITRRAESEANPWFTYMFLGADGAYEADPLFEALEQLKVFPPPPRLAVGISNSDDPAYPHDPEYDGWAFEPLPTFERCSGTNFLWQRNPYELDCMGSVGQEYAGTDFLAPYWLGVAMGYIDPRW